MKKLFTYLLAFTAVTSVFSCSESDEPDEPVPGPTITWASNPDFNKVDITDEMDVKIQVDAPAGIKTFKVAVDSDTLNTMGITEIDLIEPNENIKPFMDFILGNAGSPKDKPSYTLDISTLVPMINGLTTEESDHKFTVRIVDKNDQTATKTAVFHRVAVPKPDKDGIKTDLWANSATVQLTMEAETVEYREEGTEAWIAAKDGGNGKEWKIEPEWVKATDSPAGDADVWKPKEGTGVFAGRTYELKIDGKMSDVKIECKAGQTIPNGDMSGWSKKTMGNTELPYPNESSDNGFWDSGNNMVSQKLCEEESEGNGVAKLKPSLVLGSIFAAGNLFIGDFEMSGFTGSVKFGKKHSWVARPKALRIIYKSKVGRIDKVGSNDPLKENFTIDKSNPENNPADTARVFAAVVDWAEQHTVTSGLTAPTGVWDPCTAKNVDEGDIIGFASLYITDSKEKFTTVEIPFYWYDTSAKPGADNYSIVISCATNKRGDYMTGCSTNELYIDKFEWVY